MSLIIALLAAILAVIPVASGATSPQRHEYCVVGAGPAGLQLGYFLRSAEHDYVIIDRGERPGAFFETYPRHDTLISINKRRTDSRNTEYSLRHDWNSLLSNDPQMQMRYYSLKMFPKRHDLLLYLKDFKERFNLNVHFKSEVKALNLLPESSGYRFDLETTGERYHCQVVVVATGLFKMRPLNITGLEYTTSYDQMSLNPADYEDKRVLIIGKGNAAFETAAHIYGRTQLIHLLSRQRVRLAWSTHYVGDVRAVNNELLDTYQLKSVDALIEHDANDMIVRRRPDGRLTIGSREAERSARGGNRVAEDEADSQISTRILDKLGAENSSSVELDVGEMLDFQYDTIIRANGFEFDRSWLPNVTTTVRGKYPKIAANYESVDIPGLYFAGTLTHSLDFRKAAGGFIHGFRYTARALQRLLDVRRHGRVWPSLRQPLSGLLDTMVRRINEGSGTYQMFQNLGDIFIVDRQSSNFTLLEEFPLGLLTSLPSTSGHAVPVGGTIFVFAFEYGRNFSGPALDVFNEQRAGCDTSNGYECNFLHPVIYRYDTLPRADSASRKSAKSSSSRLPKPTSLIHLREDVHTNFRSRQAHLTPLAAFLEDALARPLYPMSEERCTLLAILHGSQQAVQSVCGDNLGQMWSAADMMEHGWRQLQD